MISDCIDYQTMGAIVFQLNKYNKKELKLNSAFNPSLSLSASVSPSNRKGIEDFCHPTHLSPDALTGRYTLMEVNAGTFSD